MPPSSTPTTPSTCGLPRCCAPGLPGGTPAVPAVGSSTSPLGSFSDRWPGSLAYAATKGAVVAFTGTLAAEVGHKGITVNAVNPGPTDTGWMTEELRKELAPKFAGGRIGAPEDAARLVAFLAGEEAAWVTGQVINSEGGFIRD